MRLIDADEVVKFYTNMGEECMELTVKNVHLGGKTAMTREEAIVAVKEVAGMSLPWNDRHYEALQMAIKALEEPKRKKGKWINGVCDQCGSHAPYWAMATTYYRSSFCPNCGADMRGEQDGQAD